MHWTLFVAARYLFAKRREKFVSCISLISVIGISLGVAALIVVLSIMTGFDEEIKEKIIGRYSHIIVARERGIADAERLMEKIKLSPDVRAASPFIDTQGVVKFGEAVFGVLVRGVDPRTEPQVTNVREFIGKGALDFGGDGIIIGSQIKRTLGISFGDKMTLISPSTKTSKDFVVKDVFNSGRYDYDANTVIISLDDAKALYGQNITGVGVRVKDEFGVTDTKNVLRRIVGDEFVIKTWQDMDENLIKALALEKKMMFFILAIIIIVACFNIAGTLIMTVMEKTKDIGILKSIGGTNSSIKGIFLLNGFLLGFIGIALGVFLGFTVALHINEISDFIEGLTGFAFFPSDVYYLNRIPIRIEPIDVARVAGIAIVISLIAALYPAWQAARLEPVEAIRYE